MSIFSNTMVLIGITALLALLMIAALCTAICAVHNKEKRLDFALLTLVLVLGSFYMMLRLCVHVFPCYIAAIPAGTALLQLLSDSIALLILYVPLGAIANYCRLYAIRRAKHHDSVFMAGIHVAGQFSDDVRGIRNSVQGVRSLEFIERKENEVC